MSASLLDAYEALEAGYWALQDPDRDLDSPFLELLDQVYARLTYEDRVYLDSRGEMSVPVAYHTANLMAVVRNHPLPNEAASRCLKEYAETQWGPNRRYLA